MDTLIPVTSSPDGTVVVEGYSFGLMVRACGALCFLVINPLFIYVWIDNPKFVEGPVDFPEIFMAIATTGMLFLGFWGLMINFAKTRVFGDAIEWGIFRRSRLDFNQIQYVDHVLRLTVSIFPAGSILRLVSNRSKKLEIVGGTDELYQCFLWLQSQYPK